MSTSKSLDRICIAAIALALVICILFMNGFAFGIEVAANTAKYESTIFDSSYVHSIDIVMDDWDSFIETCENEEYSPCTVVVDGEKYTDIGIRAKGNTSLSNVKSSGSQRYSLKLEFDQYEKGKSLDGLDKLCLNNLIQDNTMMKDYLVYTLMNEFGADSPLCSYVYVTVNGEDWGLFLAVESIEDSFLERSYGSDSGELYKPDSLSFGGGRGNGKDFNMDDFDFTNTGKDSNTGTDDNSNTGTENDTGNNDVDEPLITGATADNGNQGGMPDFGGNSGGMPDMGGNQGGMPNMGGNQGGMPDMGGNQGDTQSEQAQLETIAETDNTDATTSPSVNGGFSSGNMPNMPSDFSGEMPDFPSDFSGEMPSDFGGEIPEMPDGEDRDSSEIPGSFGNFGGGGGNSGMGSSDVKLQYIDDDPDSYSNIFDNAKTDITKSDKTRLIASLKNLSSYTNLEETLDMDEVLRYFVVHNFVCNGDSYTGSMIHNYYLYEEDGLLSMIAWDYNLAFGTFQGGNASSTVNTSIDSPVSSGSVDDRPMVGWIFSDEKYTEMYHELFSEFVTEWYDSGKLDKLISDTAELISPYVEKDPTKFCTTEEFETGVDALTEFIALRFEAVSNQLEGDNTAVETGDLNLSDMGSMGGNQGGMQSMGERKNTSADTGEAKDPNTEGTNYGSTPPEKPEGSEAEGQTPPNAGNDQGTVPNGGATEGTDSTDAAQEQGGSADNSKQQMPNGGSDQGTMPTMPDGTGASSANSPIVYLGISFLVLAAGLVFAVRKK